MKDQSENNANQNEKKVLQEEISIRKKMVAESRRIRSENMLQDKGFFMKNSKDDKVAWERLQLKTQHVQVLEEYPNCV